MKHVLNKSFTLWLASLLLFAMTVHAEANVPNEAPDKMLESVTQEMFSVLKRERSSIKQKPTRLFDLVEQVLLPHVDMQVMSRFVLGKHWRSATPAQKEQFSNEFKNLMVRFYVSALLDQPDQLDELLANTDNLIAYLPVKIDDSTKKTTVRAEVHMPNGGPRVPVSFSLFKRDGNWMMYDVNVDGISLVSNYRSSFNSEASRDGLDKLIQHLAKRNKSLLEKYNRGESGALKDRK
jgi:phospholipid transport system substrate-binding protein